MKQEDMLNRLRRIEGQLRGVQRMIEEERKCEEIFVQLAAATAALRRASLSYFAGKLGECIAAGQSRETGLSPERLEEIFVRMG